MRTANTGAARSVLPILPLALLLLGLAACAQVKPFEYTEIHEIPPGPGLVSGEDGEFVLYSTLQPPPSDGSPDN